jgi:hypothetical protein
MARCANATVRPMRHRATWPIARRKRRQRELGRGPFLVCTLLFGGPFDLLGIRKSRLASHFTAAFGRRRLRLRADGAASRRRRTNPVVDVVLSARGPASAAPCNRSP